MKGLLDGVFARYGMDGEIISLSGSRTVKCFFHPVNSRSWQNTRREFSPLGEVPGGQYVGMFPADAAVTAGDTVTVNGASYKVGRAESMCDSRGVVYYWCLCTGKGDGDHWAQTE